MLLPWLTSGNSLSLTTCIVCQGEEDKTALSSNNSLGQVLKRKLQNLRIHSSDTKTINYRADEVSQSGTAEF